MPQFGDVKVRLHVGDLNVGSIGIQLGDVDWIRVFDHDQIGRPESLAVEILHCQGIFFLSTEGKRKA